MTQLIRAWTNWESKSTKWEITQKYFVRQLIIQREFWPNSEGYCTNKLINPDCFMINMLTKIVATSENKENNFLSMSFSVDMSNDPSFVVASQPKIVPIDYITYVLSACGTWFGISFLVLNPLTLVQYMKRKHSTSQPAVGNEVFSEIAQLKSEMSKLIEKNNVSKNFNLMLINRVRRLENDRELCRDKGENVQNKRDKTAKVFSSSLALSVDYKHSSVLFLTVLNDLG